MIDVDVYVLFLYSFHLYFIKNKLDLIQHTIKMNSGGAILLAVCILGLLTSLSIHKIDEGKNFLLDLSFRYFLFLMNAIFPKRPCWSILSSKH